MYVIGKRFRFSASHRLDRLPDSHPCWRLHGHNYQVEVVLSAEKLDEFAMVADFGRLAPVRTHIDGTLDHRHLNDVLDDMPTSEHLARHLFGWCRINLEPAVSERLAAVRVWETDTSWAEYRP